MKQMNAVLEECGIDVNELISLGGGEQRAAQIYTGTKALMLAVLEDGINSYFYGKGRIRTEAEHWISTPRRHAPLSFAIIGETLGLEPPAVRAAVRRLRDAQV